MAIPKYTEKDPETKTDGKEEYRMIQRTQRKKHRIGWTWRRQKMRRQKN